MSNRFYQFFLFVTLYSISSNADGFHVSGADYHLQEPTQKAIIYWNDSTEYMHLSSAVKSSEIQNFAWIVPILSLKKPIVTKGDISLFKDMIQLFDGATLNISTGSGFGGMIKAADGISILESKEIDIFDITILQAKNSSTLFQWLITNGYKVDKTIKPILDKYIETKKCYFVINKIDLLNKYSNEVKVINRRYDQRAKSFKTISDSLELILSQILEKKGIAGKLNKENLTSKEYRNKYYWNSTYFNHLCVEYINQPSNPLHIPINLKNSKPPIIDLTKWGFSFASGQYSFGPGQSDSMKIQLMSFKKWMDEIHNLHIIPLLRIYEKERSENYSDESFPLDPETGDIRVPLYTKLVRLKSDTFYHKSVSSPKYKKLEKDLSDLSNGLGTPLIFKFQPPKPFFPLYISSVGKGNSLIEVYCINNRRVIDKENILKFSAFKIMNDKLYQKIKSTFKTNIGKSVTRLTWRGNLNQLKGDAYFE